MNGEHFGNLSFLESVSKLVSREGGKYYKKIMKCLTDLKMYNVYDRILNTKEHGIPQSRPRWYCVGMLWACGDRNGYFMELRALFIASHQSYKFQQHINILQYLATLCQSGNLAARLPDCPIGNFNLASYPAWVLSGIPTPPQFFLLIN